MCCVIARKTQQCIGMNLKASLNEFRINCKCTGAIRAADPGLQLKVPVGLPQH